MPVLRPVLAGMLWMVASGLLLVTLNAIMRGLSQVTDPYQAQFLRYLCGMLVLLPMVARRGLLAFRPYSLAGQLWRGAVHTSALLLWFTALPFVPMADMTALGFTSPLFLMLGAVIFFGEKMILARWVAAGIGFVGVLIVVGPALGGAGGVYNLVMLASSPLFAASFLITKALTRRDSPEVIVLWQALMVSVLTLPIALLGWVPLTLAQYGWFLVAGLLGSAGHYCLTRAFTLADMSATQPVKFLDLLWSVLFGLFLFGEVPSGWTLAGAAVIFASATWLARREARS